MIERAGAGIIIVPARLFVFVIFSFPVLPTRSVYCLSIFLNSIGHTRNRSIIQPSITYLYIFPVFHCFKYKNKVNYLQWLLISLNPFLYLQRDFTFAGLCTKKMLDKLDRQIVYDIPSTHRDRGCVLSSVAAHSVVQNRLGLPSGCFGTAAFLVL